MSQSVEGERRFESIAPASVTFRSRPKPAAGHTRLAALKRSLHAAVYFTAAVDALRLLSTQESRSKGMANADRRRAIVPIIFGVFLIWSFGWDTVGRRLRLAVDGVIVRAVDVPATGAPRYATEYTIRGAHGKEQIYWAGPTDGSLPRSMPVGTRIRKERWHLEYERNARTEGFPYVFYSVVLMVAAGLLAWGLFNFFRAPTRNNGGIES